MSAGCQSGNAPYLGVALPEPVCCLPAVLESSVTPLCVPERDVHPAERVIRKG